MTRPPYLAGAAIVALFAVGVVATREGDTLTIASETSSPWATAATVPDSLATGNAPAEVESGTRNATHKGAPDEAVTDEAGGSVSSGAPPISGGGITGVANVEGAPADLAVVDTPAERRQNFVQVGTTVVPTGLHGMPFAPVELTSCDEMHWYREQAGLIAHFDGLGFRESSCGNDNSSYCCHGYWQLHERFWVPMPECGIATVDDLLGTDPLDKQRNACAAAVVYEEQGGGAWDAW